MSGNGARTASHEESVDSSSANIERCLDRVAQRDSVIQAWAFLDPELARDQARDRDRTPRRSSMHGVPVGVKDIIDTADQPTGYGSPAFSGHRPTHDADVVRRLRHAGAVIFGKTTSTEFATYHPTQTRNPHNAGHTPGGSSSGSAAAVADGQVPVALGTQTAGSVLRPGAFCGVYTLKPTYGRWIFDGVLPVALSFDTIGGFARHPVWLGALDHAVAAPTSEGTLPPTQRLRVGVLRPPWAGHASPAAAAMLERVAGEVGEFVEQVVDVDVPAILSELDDAHTLIMAVEASAALAEKVAHAGLGGISEDLAQFLSVGENAEPNSIQNARTVLRSARRFLDQALCEVDVLLTLSSTGEAPAGFESTGNPVFNKLASVGGNPAIGLPTGTGADRLPLGIQLIGPAHSDQSLVRIATCLTDRVGLSARCPLPEES